MDINVTIKAENGFVEALNRLADAMKNTKVVEMPVTVEKTTTQQTQAAPVQAQTTTQEQTQQTQAAPVQAQAPQQTAPVQAQATTYTLDDLSKAAVSLMDAGKQQELLNLLAQFGVQSMPQLQPDRYGAFATALREKGAAI